MQNIGKIYYFAYCRCFLYYFVKFQLNENSDNNVLNNIHEYLYRNSGSDLGKMIILYIIRLFGLYEKEKQNYFFEEYSIENDNYNWKQSIISQNEKLLFFPINEYENSKNFLFILWPQINNDNINE